MKTIEENDARSRRAFLVSYVIMEILAQIGTILLLVSGTVDFRAFAIVEILALFVPLIIAFFIKMIVW